MRGLLSFFYVVYVATVYEEYAPGVFVTASAYEESASQSHAQVYTPSNAINGQSECSHNHMIPYNARQSTLTILRYFLTYSRATVIQGNPQHFLGALTFHAPGPLGDVTLILMSRDKIANQSNHSKLTNSIHLLRQKRVPRSPNLFLLHS